MSVPDFCETYPPAPPPAPWIQQAPVAPSNLDGARDNMSEALDCLHRRLESLTSRLKPVTRLPTPLAPTAGQPVPPKPFDASSPLLSEVCLWGRTINSLADKILELEKTLDI